MYENESEKSCDNQASHDGLATPGQRKAFLESDEMCGAVEPDRVWCKRCEKWIALQGAKYFHHNWAEHCARSIHIDAAQNNTTQYV